MSTRMMDNLCAVLEKDYFDVFDVWLYQILPLYLSGHKSLLTLAGNDPKWYPDIFRFPRTASYSVLLTWGFESISEHQLFCVGLLSSFLKIDSVSFSRDFQCFKNKIWLIYTPSASETWRGRLRSSTLIKLRPRPNVSGYFRIRNFFFPDTATVNTYSANSTANPESHVRGN